MDYKNEMEISEPIRKVSAETRDLKYSTYTATDLLNMEIDEVPMLWSPFFPSTAVVGLTGSSDCGKSILLRQLAIAICLQREEFLDYPLNWKYGRAIYVCTEDDNHGIAFHLKKQVGDAERKQLDNLTFVFDSENLVAEIDELLESNKADLVVLDVWSDSFVGNPNNWVDVRQNLKKIRSLAQKHGCLIAFIHHTIKNSEKSAPDKSKLNGSQAIEAKIRCLLELRKGSSNDERFLHVLKNNYMSNEQKSEGLVLELHRDRLLFTNTGRKVSITGNIRESGSRKYETDVWIQRMNEFREMSGCSFERARERLIGQYPNEDVPGLTWFKMNCKPSDGQSLEEKVG